MEKLFLEKTNEKQKKREKTVFVVNNAQTTPMKEINV